MRRALSVFTRPWKQNLRMPRRIALIGLGHGLRAVLSFAAPQRVMPMAKEAALKALAIDETVAEAHFAMAFVLNYGEWDWEGAEREYRRALELNPADTLARGTYGILLGGLGPPHGKGHKTYRQNTAQRCAICEKRLQLGN